MGLPLRSLSWNLLDHFYPVLSIIYIVSSRNNEPAFGPTIALLFNIFNGKTEELA